MATIRSAGRQSLFTILSRGSSSWLFRLLIKGIFGPYVLWPFDKKLIFWIVTRVSARDYTVILKLNILTLQFKLDQGFCTLTKKEWSGGTVDWPIMLCTFNVM